MPDLMRSCPKRSIWWRWWRRNAPAMRTARCRAWHREIPGDPRLLRRQVRNLLEKAHNHAAPPVEAEIVYSAEAVALTVSDGGHWHFRSGQGKGVPAFLPRLGQAECTGIWPRPAAGASNRRSPWRIGRHFAAPGRALIDTGNSSGRGGRMKNRLVTPRLPGGQYPVSKKKPPHFRFGRHSVAGLPQVCTVAARRPSSHSSPRA